MILYLYTYLLAYLQDWSLLQKGQLWWPSALQPLWWTPAFKGRITTPRTYAKPNMRKVGQQQRKQSKLGMLIYTTLLVPKNESSIYTLSFCRTKMVLELSKINLDQCKVEGMKDQIRDYRHTMAKSLILCNPNSNPNPK